MFKECFFCKRKNVTDGFVGRAVINKKTKKGINFKYDCCNECYDKYKFSELSIEEFDEIMKNERNLYFDKCKR